ncbi:SDR family NAD(P)-dependent oxidoreductase [Candidatus Neomarinimicrobiota bacterium]
MSFDFKNKTVLITGASGGIGRRVAQQFDESGACLALHYNSNKEKAQQLLDSLTGSGHFLIQSDLQDPNAIAELSAKTIAKFNKLDILVNNAGIYNPHPIKEVSYEEWLAAWQATIRTNLFGPANLTFCIAQEMRKTGGGKIVNISSRGAFRGEPDAPAYGASKAGLNAMGQSLSQALASENIFIYTIAPGFVETAMARPHLTADRKGLILKQSPLGRVAKPEEIAKTVLFVASEGTDFLTGGIIDINGASYLRS